MKKVLVTGGSGFVGQYLIPRLIKQGYEVLALARSEKSAELLRKAGTKVLFADLESLQPIEKEFNGIKVVFHLAASVDFYASEKELYALHVKATEDLLNYSVKWGVENFIYLGAASVIMNGKVIKMANEDFVADQLYDGYSKTKLQAEKMVLAKNAPTFKTISLKPPLIWGKGDPNVLPKIVEAVAKKQFRWIAKGMHPFSTCHVENVCEALLLAENSSQGGKSYFITDGEHPIFRDFIQNYAATKGIKLPETSVSLSSAKRIAFLMEFIWKLFYMKGTPPFHSGFVRTLGLEFTLDDSKARKELGYQSSINIQRGLEKMRT